MTGRLVRSFTEIKVPLKPWRDPLTVFLASSAVICAILSIWHALFVGGAHGVFTLPIVIQSALILLAVVAVRHLPASGSISGVLVLLGLEVARGCVVPVLIQFMGQETPEYRKVGTVEGAVASLGVGNQFLLGVVVCILFTGAVVSNVGKAVSSSDDSVRALDRMPAMTRGAWGFIFIGVLALVARFYSLDLIREFLSGTYEGLQTAPIGGFLGFASAILRPLLPLGIGLLIIRAKMRGESSLAYWPLFIIAIFFSLGSYGLNRATIILPIAAMFLAYLSIKHVRVGSRKAVIGIGMAAVAFFGVGALRSSLFAERIGNSIASQGVFYDAAQTLMIYAQSPLQSGIAFDAASATGPWDVRSFLFSMISPIPGVPDTWRRGSGTAIYNYVVYGNDIAKDQIFPSWLEAYFSIGFLAPFFLGMVAAALLIRLDRARAKSLSFIGAYAACLASLIVAQISISSFTAVVQQLLYFAFVPSLIWLVSRLRSGS